MMEVEVKEKPFLGLLLVMFLFLFVMNFLVHYVKAVYGHDYLLGFHEFFSFYEEANLPTWYSSLLLIVGAIILWIIAAKDASEDKKYWTGLAFLLLFLSVDETARIHELVGWLLARTPVRELLSTGGNSVWVLYGFAMTLLVVAVFFRFWTRLGSRIRWLFFWSAFIYVGGALGLEIVELYYAAVHGVDAGFYALSTIEESMEMLGIILFIHALLIQVRELRCSGSE